MTNNTNSVLRNPEEIIDYLETAEDNSVVVSKAPNHLYLMIRGAKSVDGVGDEIETDEELIRFAGSYILATSIKDGISRTEVSSDNINILCDEIRKFLNDHLTEEHREDLLSCFENGQLIRNYDSFYISVSEEIQYTVMSILKELLSKN